MPNSIIFRFISQRYFTDNLHNISVVAFRKSYKRQGENRLKKIIKMGMKSGSIYVSECFACVHICTMCAMMP